MDFDNVFNTQFIEFIKMNTFNKYKLNPDILEIILYNYILNNIIYDKKTKVIYKLYTNKLYIYKILHKNNFIFSNYTIDKLIENNEIDILTYILENKMLYNYNFKYCNNLDIFKLFIKYQNINITINHVKYLFDNNTCDILEWLILNNINIKNTIISIYENRDYYNNYIDYNNIYNLIKLNHLLKITLWFDKNNIINNIMQYGNYDIKIFKLLLDNDMLLINTKLIFYILNDYNKHNDMLEIIKLINNNFNKAYNNTDNYQNYYIKTNVDILMLNNLELFIYYINNKHKGIFQYIYDNSSYYINNKQIIQLKNHYHKLINGSIIKYVYDNTDIKLNSFLIYNSIYYEQNIELLIYMHENKDIIFDIEFFMSTFFLSIININNISLDIVNYIIDNISIDNNDINYKQYEKKIYDTIIIILNNDLLEFIDIFFKIINENVLKQITNNIMYLDNNQSTKYFISKINNNHE